MLMEKHQLFTKPEAPKESWWLSQGTREDFQRAHERQLERMKRDGKQTGGEMRVVGTDYGSI
jgi:hypothetical protein